MDEKVKASANGVLSFLVLTATALTSIFVAIYAIGQEQITLALICAGGLVVAVALLTGLYSVEPNQAAVLSFFGKYIGTVKDQGLRWNNPLFQKRKVSLRIRNFESSRLKVNDLEGSPIEIAAIVVWQVVDSAEAVFNVDDYESFVQIQSESALRTIAGTYPYDQQNEDKPALRSHSNDVVDHLKQQVQSRLSEAGVDVTEVRISHLAYSPEIAHAMLQRQQANAVVAARTRIVEGAVGMVEMALDSLKAKEIVEFTPEKKASMVSDLMVVLCSDKSATPVIQTGGD